LAEKASVFILRCDSYFYRVSETMQSTKQTRPGADSSEKRSSGHLKLLAKAAGISLAALVFSKIASYGFRWVGAMLGTAEYGLFAMAFGVFELVVGLGLLGVDFATARFIVDESIAKKNPRLSSNSFWYGVRVVLVSGTVLAICLALASGWIASNVFHSPSMWPSLVVFALTVPFFLLVLVFVATMRGLKRVKYEAIAKSVIESALRPFFAFIAIILGLGAFGLSVSVFVSALIVFLFCVFWSRKFFPQPWIESIVSARRPEGFFRFCLPLYTSNLLSIVISNSVLFALGLMIGTSEAGVFSAVMPLAMFIVTPATAILAIFISVGSEMRAFGRHEESHGLYQSLVKAILMATIPLSVVLAFFSREALTFLYLIDYSQGALALSILSVGYLIYSTFTPAANYLQVLKRTNWLLFNLAFSAVLVFASIALFVPTYGTAGAALAFVVGAVAQVLLAVVEVWWFAKMQPFSGAFLRTLLAGCIALIPLYFLNGAFGLRGFNRVVFGAMLYCASYAVLLFALRAFDRDDIELLKSVELRSGVRLGPVRGMLKRFYFGSGK